MDDLSLGDAPARDLAEPAVADLPVAASAVRLLDLAKEAEQGIIFLARGERRAALMAEMLAGLAPEIAVLPFPAWDCVPYDRAGPSRDVMGQRIETMRRLAGGLSAPRVVVTTAAALAQRVPPRRQWGDAALKLSVGDEISVHTLRSFLVRSGYILDDRVDESGEAAIRGAVIDLFPSGAGGPIRIDHTEGRITGIRAYDAVSQRTLENRTELMLMPASEVVLPEESEGEHFVGIEHFLPEFCGPLETLFDYAPDAALAVEPGAARRYEAFWEQVQDAHETRRSMPNGAGARTPPEPAELYMDPAEWRGRLKAMRRLDFTLDGISGLPKFRRETRPDRAFASFVTEQTGRKLKIVVAASDDGQQSTLIRRARRAAGADVQKVASLTEVGPAPGPVLALSVDLDGGFIDARRGLALVAAADLLGSSAQVQGEATGRAELGLAQVDLRAGDVVVHIDHGLAVLKDIETVTPPEGTSEDALVLEFAGEAKLMVPAAEIGRMWRYGSEAEAVSLDRLGGDSWAKRKTALEADLVELAGKLVALASEREEARAEPLVPTPRDYERFSEAFAYSETPDQAAAIDEVLRDLASGRPMNRLVCGDVGFGKTEVALRAAAAAALAGKQVAIVAPTTVLVRQHVQTFTRRFARLGLEVAHLSRLVKPAEARRVKEGLASGEIRIVIGTHALAGKGVEFENLGLLVIDEEQRFGAKQKDKLRGLGDSIHVLTMTATPIPRTLEWAMLGLQDVSVIATPPVRRQPIRTFLTPFDPVTVRAALLRERQRGGQSFVVCPRIEDIQPMAEQLGELVPELRIVQAHGKLPADEMDAVMVSFADGEGDVLLATNIIESGLDVPRANTMLIWRADRFGLAQLHQLRGRVGRGRARGTAYLLTDPAAKIAKATEQRLRTLEAMDRLGAGFAISGRDLDLRGAGDLLGEEQAGHMKLIGLGLYQHLLRRALSVARGEEPEEDWTAAIRLGLDAAIPEDYIPEPELRIDLHSRLARLSEEDEPETLAEEIADRFGPLPEQVANLVALAHLRRSAHRLGIAKLDAGPEAVAATFREGAALKAVAHVQDAGIDGLEWRGERLIWSRQSGSAEERRELAGKLLALVTGKTGGERRKAA